jgi:hypothetical protein
VGAGSRGEGGGLARGGPQHYLPTTSLCQGAVYGFFGVLPRMGAVDSVVQSSGWPRFVHNSRHFRNSVTRQQVEVAILGSSWPARSSTIDCASRSRASAALFGAGNIFKLAGLNTVRRRPPLLPSSAALPASECRAQYLLPVRALALHGLPSRFGFWQRIAVLKVQEEVAIQKSPMKRSLSGPEEPKSRGRVVYFGYR